MRKENHIMGMSASQARLLSITSRLTNNEFRAQTITNSKLRLASESEEASRQYMDALESKKLVYGVYDDNGDRTYANLTANLLLGYGDLKNQYNLVNPSGQILLNGTDIKNYMEATSFSDFMSKYGIPSVTNPEYVDYMTDLFGENYEKLFDENNPYKYIRCDEGYLAYIEWINGFFNDNGNLDKNSVENLTKDDIVDYKGYLNNAKLNTLSGITNFDSSEATMFNYFVTTINSVPDYVEKPKEVQEPNLLDYAQAILSPQCWQGTGIKNLDADGKINMVEDGLDKNWHMEHVLAQFLWADGYNNSTMELKDSDGEIIGTIINNNSKYWGVTGGGPQSTLKPTLAAIDTMKVQTVLDKPENKALKSDLTKLYFQVVSYNEKYCDKKMQGGSTISFKDAETAESFMADITLETIGENFVKLMNDLCQAVAKDIIDTKDTDRGYGTGGIKEYVDEMTKYEEYLDNKAKYEEFEQEFSEWVKTANNVIDNFETLIENIPDSEIPDSKDAKYQWYLNLWERMGGGKKDAYGNLDTGAFKEIDENLINNPEWLEFALEHGIVTLEQAIFKEDGSTTYPGMGTFDWVSKAYTSATDIVSQDDEIAIAIAEAKYKKTVKEIENKDKKYDQDLKKLDTEHSALQTEYESIKEVISKNAERSFKAFS